LKKCSLTGKDDLKRISTLIFQYKASSNSNKFFKVTLISKLYRGNNCLIKGEAEISILLENIFKIVPEVFTVITTVEVRHQNYQNLLFFEDSF